MAKKKTLVLGATDNPSRYAFACVHRLVQHGHEVVPVSIKKGKVAGLEILNDMTPQPDIDTITLYVGTRNLPYWYDYIINTKPKRLIFNPGTEDMDLARLATAAGIDVVQNCTLVMLSIGAY